MFKFGEVVYLKPSTFNHNCCILGIGKCFLLMLLLSSLKSEMKRIVPFFLGIIKVRAAHLELFSRFYTAMFIILLTSILEFFVYFRNWKSFGMI